MSSIKRSSSEAFHSLFLPVLLSAVHFGSQFLGVMELNLKFIAKSWNFLSSFLCDPWVMVAGLDCVKFKGEAGVKLRALNSVLHSSNFWLIETSKFKSLWPVFNSYFSLLKFKSQHVLFCWELQENITFLSVLETMVEKSIRLSSLKATLQHWWIVAQSKAASTLYSHCSNATTKF